MEYSLRMFLRRKRKEFIVQNVEINEINSYAKFFRNYVADNLKEI